MGLRCCFNGYFARSFSVGCRHRSGKELEEYKLDRLWIEKYGLKQHELKKKEEKRNEFSHFRDELVHKLMTLGYWLRQKDTIRNYLERTNYEDKVISQQFIQERVDILGPDLAVAHFITFKGGNVKFLGHKEWTGRDYRQAKLPLKYIPGYFIEAINASDTDLMYEGLDCLRGLNKLKWLSLKGLVKVNDFGLDIIASRYGRQLEYLDLTGCTGISHYGLSSFYRFQSLKTLVVADIQHSLEFKLSCLMIQDLLPDLEIQGIDFSGTELKETSQSKPC